MLLADSPSNWTKKNPMVSKESLELLEGFNKKEIQEIFKAKIIFQEKL